MPAEPSESRPKLTRREVDNWLFKLEAEISAILKGPAGELRARLVLILRQIRRWRDRVGVWR